MDFAESQGASMIIRGLRAVADFEYEFQMAGMNQQLNDDIETVFLMADVSLQPIASRLVKEIARYGGCDRQVRHAGRGSGRETTPRRRSRRMIGRVLFSLAALRWLPPSLLRSKRRRLRPLPPEHRSAGGSCERSVEQADDSAQQGGTVVILLRPDAAPLTSSG